MHYTGHYTMTKPYWEMGVAISGGGCDEISDDGGGGEVSDVSSGDNVGVMVDNVRSLRVVAVMKSQMGAMVEVSDYGSGG